MRLKRRPMERTATAEGDVKAGKKGRAAQPAVRREAAE